MKHLIFKTLSIIGVSIILAGCSGVSVESSNSDTTSSTPTSTTTSTSTTKKDIKVGTGVYVDTVVEGVEYQCGDIDGATDSDGIFVYELGKSCTFKIGALKLRDIEASKLTKDGVIIQETDEKISQLLLSLNISTDPKKVIKIDKILAKEFDGEYYKKDIKDADVEELIRHAEDELRKKGIEKEPLRIVDKTKAREHLKDSYQTYSKAEGFVLADEDDDIFDDVPNQSTDQEGSHSKDGSLAQNGKDREKNDKDDASSNLGDETTQTSTAQTQTSTTTSSSTSSTQTYVEDYSYLPTKDELSDEMAVKFLNMATFGATPKLVAELKSKGIKKWVEEQLEIPYNEKKDSILRGIIKTLTSINTTYYSRDNVSVDEWLKDNNGYYFNQGKRGGPNELAFHYSKVFDAHMRYKGQLRQRVAYALSQIIVVSQSNDLFFTEKGEALSYYYDILQKRAFGNYGDLLYDISMSPAMATFLTFAGNRKEYVDEETGARILPDENYGREIMQLFSIGLYELNMDGTQKRASGGARVPTYTQEDVNNLSRVFTGLSYAHTKFGETLLRGDNTHQLECFMDYHDTGEKKVLGTTLPAGQNCEQDVKSAVDLLMRHQNVAPFIAKKLIMRLTKSNPKDDYVRRVAETFARSGGNLKETVKAVLLDPEIWENIKNGDGVKIKEPYLAFTQTLRALGAKTLPKMSWINKEKKRVTLPNEEFISDSLYDSLGEWPTTSPTVFNFYDDEFVPDNNEFKVRGFVAPELEIITAKYNVAYNNTLQDIISHNALPLQLNDRGQTPEENPTIYGNHRVYLYFDYKDILNVFKKNGFGEGLDEGHDAKTAEKVAGAVIDYISELFLGKKLSNEQREILVNRYKGARYWNRGDHSLEYMEKMLVLYWIKGIVVDITHTDEFMVQ